MHPNFRIWSLTFNPQSHTDAYFQDCKHVLSKNFLHCPLSVKDLPSPYDMVLQCLHYKPIMNLIPFCIPLYFPFKHILFVSLENFPFVQLEVTIFLVEFLLFYLIDLCNCREHSSSIKLILSLLIQILIVLFLTMFVQFEEIGLFVEPPSLLCRLFLISLSYNIFIFIFELTHLKATLSSPLFSFFILELRRHTHHIVTTVLLLFHRLCCSNRDCAA